PGREACEVRAITGSLLVAAADGARQAGLAVREVGRPPNGLLRCIFGNPFRPAAVPAAWLAWRDGTIPRLAQAGYHDRAFDHLPILADALEAAGCADTDILNHCRGPGPHVRGCWVVDLLLGKG